jgi:hypothetical protein
MKIDTGVFEFRDPKLERSAALTPADRKWMDDILTDVNESWTAEGNGSPTGMQQFKGSDDYLRSKVSNANSSSQLGVFLTIFIVRGICSSRPFICQISGLRCEGRK